MLTNSTYSSKLCAMLFDMKSYSRFLYDFHSKLLYNNPLEYSASSEVPQNQSILSTKTLDHILIAYNNFALLFYNHNLFILIMQGYIN